MLRTGGLVSEAGTVRSSQRSGRRYRCPVAGLGRCAQNAQSSASVAPPTAPTANGSLGAARPCRPRPRTVPHAAAGGAASSPSPASRCAALPALLPFYVDSRPCLNCDCTLGATSWTAKDTVGVDTPERLGPRCPSIAGVPAERRFLPRSNVSSDGPGQPSRRPRVDHRQLQCQALDGYPGTSQHTSPSQPSLLLPRLAGAGTSAPTAALAPDRTACEPVETSQTALPACEFSTATSATVALLLPPPPPIPSNTNVEFGWS